MYLTLEMVKFKQPEPNKEIHKKTFIQFGPNLSCRKYRKETLIWLWIDEAINLLLLLRNFKAIYKSLKIKFSIKKDDANKPSNLLKFVKCNSIKEKIKSVCFDSWQNYIRNGFVHQQGRW